MGSLLLLLLLLEVSFISSQEITISQNVTGSLSSSFNRFGFSSTSLGDIVVIGAPTTIPPQANRRIYIFNCSSLPCQEREVIGFGEPNFGYSVSISPSSLLVVGNWENSQTVSGDAVLFDCSTSPCDFEGFISPPSTEPDFGISVAVSDNNLVAVSAPSSNIVFLFDCTVPFSCSLVGSVTANGTGERFGTWVTFNGSRLAVGATLTASSGALYLFDCSNPSSCSQQTVFSPNNATSSQFGHSVLFGPGDTIFVAAPGLNSQIGGVYFLDCPPSGPCSQLQRIEASDINNTEDRFGQSLAFKGTTLVVGAYGDDENGFFDRGSAYYFDCSAFSSCTEVAKLVPSSGQDELFFGSSLTFSNSYLVVGATGFQVFEGIAYFQTLPLPVPLNVTLTIPNRSFSGSGGTLSMTLIGSAGTSQPLSLGGGFTEGEERNVPDLIADDVGDLYAIELSNSLPNDGLRLRILEFIYKGMSFTFGKNVMIRNLRTLNGRSFFLPFFFSLFFFFFLLTFKKVN